MPQELKNRSAVKPLKRRNGKNDREKRYEFLCILPAITLLIITNYYPLADLFRISFTNWNLLNADYKYVGLKNWAWLWKDLLGGGRVLNAFGVTFVYTIGHMLLLIAGGLLLALLFNRMTRTFSILRALVFMPKYIAASSAAIVFLWLFNTEYGYVNFIVRQLGGENIGWLSNKTLAMVTLILVTSWHGVGYDMMIYLSAMRGISKEYYEAAMIDGAGRTACFFRITLPLLAPTTVFLMVTQFIGSMKVFQSVDVLTGGGPSGATDVIVNNIYQLAFKDYRIDRAAVVSILFFIVLLVFTRLTVKWTDRSVNYDA